jgi:hypothetical protein
VYPAGPEPITITLRTSVLVSAMVVRTPALVEAANAGAI